MQPKEEKGFKYNWDCMLEMYDGDLLCHFKQCFWWNKWQLLNWLENEHRYWGFEFIWYDGPHYSFGFWYFNIVSSPKYDLKPEPPNSVKFITNNTIKSKWKRFKKKIFK